MKKETIDIMIEGGKASAAPPLGPALGPMGININEVITTINKKTSAMAGMQVPVKVIIDTETKEFEIEIGTPPTSALLLKEAGLPKGSSNPKKEKIGNLKIEQIIKVAVTKEDKLGGKTLKDKVKEIIGSCKSTGLLVEGKDPSETIKDVDKGIYDKPIEARKTALTEEEKIMLEQEKKKLQEEVAKIKAKEMEEARVIATDLFSKGKQQSKVESTLTEKGFDPDVIKLVVQETKAVAGAGAVVKKPAEPAKK